jgi:hypothetical protein
MDRARLVRYDERPQDHTPIRTVDLPPTPTRDRNIMATAWVEAPESLLTLGDDLPDRPSAEYKRRIGPWILWRAGPAKRGDARYWVAHDTTGAEFTLRLFPDGTAQGVGPTGTVHSRFRAWKEDLRDAQHPLGGQMLNDSDPAFQGDAGAGRVATDLFEEGSARNSTS